MHQPKELVPNQLSFSEFLAKFIAFNVFIFGTLYVAVATSTPVLFAIVIQMLTILVYITWGFIAANNARLKQEALAKKFIRRPFVQGIGITLYSFLYLGAGSSLFGFFLMIIFFLVPPFSLFDPYAGFIVVEGLFKEANYTLILLKFVVGALGSALLASWLAAIVANGLKKGSREVRRRLLPSTIGLAINAMPYGIAYVSMTVVAALIPTVSTVMNTMNAFGDMTNSEFGSGFELLKAMPWFMLLPVSAGVLLIFYRSDVIAFFKERQSPSLYFVSLKPSALSIWNLCRKTLTYASVFVVIAFTFSFIVDGLNGTAAMSANKIASGSYEHINDWIKGQIGEEVESENIVAKIGDGYWSSEFPKDGLTHIIPEFEGLMKVSESKMCRVRLTAKSLAPELAQLLKSIIEKTGTIKIKQNQIAYCLRVLCTSEALPDLGPKIWVYSSHGSNKKYWFANGQVSIGVFSNDIKSSGGFCTKEGLLADTYQG